VTEEERTIFHKNYEYMWEKLNTTHYYLKGPSTSAQAMHARQRIKGIDLLPAYSICSQCKSGTYAPSNKTVMKFVTFYNENITPATSFKEFLHTDLSLLDDSRYIKISGLDKKYINIFKGIYYGYYISASEAGEVHGAVLKIFESEKMLRAVLVTGIFTDEEMSSEALTDLFRNKQVTKERYDHYFNSQSIKNKRSYFYDGDVEITNESIFIVFRGHDVECRKLVFTLDNKNYPKRLDRSYLGGLAFIMSTNSGPLNTRFYQMGILNSAVGLLSFSDERISRLLKLKTDRNDVQLDNKKDGAWLELAMKLQ